VWWLARGEHELPADAHWLAPGEAARAAGLRYPKRRTEYLLRRLVAKSAVAALAGVELARVEVRNAPSGAPYALVDGARSGMDLSISDRAGWAVCLVAVELGAVGCDLELVEPRSPGFVSDFLTEAERSYVAAQPAGEARDAAANLIWSAKESAVKVLRTGLRRDTRSVEVTVHDGQDGWSPLAIRPAEGGQLPGWWRRDGRFVVTVAATTAVPPPAALEDPRALALAVPRHSWLDKPIS
jgi:4'-phosphopantetheinyl transferase